MTYANVNTDYICYFARQWLDWDFSSYYYRTVFLFKYLFVIRDIILENQVTNVAILLTTEETSMSNNYNKYRFSYKKKTGLCNKHRYSTNKYVNNIRCLLWNGTNKFLKSRCAPQRRKYRRLQSGNRNQWTILGLAFETTPISCFLNLSIYVRIVRGHFVLSDSINEAHVNTD